MNEKLRCLGIRGVGVVVPVDASPVADRDRAVVEGDGALATDVVDITDSLFEARIAAVALAVDDEGGGPRDFDRSLDPPMTLRKKPRIPRSRSGSRVVSDESDDVGLESNSTTGESVVCRFRTTPGPFKAA